jgi:hypothetical protein
MNTNKCKVLECSEDAVMGSVFCEKHRLSIDGYCSECHRKLKIKPKNYEIDKEFYCRSCSSRLRISEYNNSEVARTVRHENMTAYNNSDIGKKNREKGLKVIHSTYTGSPEHMQQIRSLGLMRRKNTDEDNK